MKFLTDLIENVGNFAIQREQIRAGVGLGSSGEGNAASDHPYVKTGTDYDGSTLVQGRLIDGVSNAAILAGVGGIAALVVLAVAMAND